MLDFYEFTMKLNPNIDDTQEDQDQDQMTNFWEFTYDLNVTNPIDAFWDPDGDHISNIEEFLGGSDPVFENLSKVGQLSLTRFSVPFLLR